MNQLRNQFYRFMTGRYGVDALSKFLLGLCVAVMAVNLAVRLRPLNLLAMALIVLIYFRMFSKNIQARYAENQKFLGLKDRIAAFFGRQASMGRDLRENHIYRCPSCSQKIRIPRGKGKIMVTCPKCHTEFMKKS